MAKTGTRTARTGMAVLLGLNAVDPKHYDGWSGELAACERDARDMTRLARGRKMKVKTLLTKQATRARLLSAVRAAAKTLKRGDLFFLTYSGHGGQVRDVTGDEEDRRDETWCLYDGQLIDDELYYELSRFAAGVRILVLSDSCHSGTVTRANASLANTAGPYRSRMMPPAIAEATYARNKDFYDGLQRTVAKAADRRAADPDAVLAGLETDPRLASMVTKFKPAAILISGCQDNQTSMDGDPNGAFTGALLDVWRDGAFTGDYPRFHAEIVSRLPASQTPNLFTLGPAGRFAKEAPFTV